MRRFLSCTGVITVFNQLLQIYRLPYYHSIQQKHSQVKIVLALLGKLLADKTKTYIIVFMTPQSYPNCPT